MRKIKPPSHLLTLSKVCVNITLGLISVYLFLRVGVPLLGLETPMELTVGLVLISGIKYYIVDRMFNFSYYRGVRKGIKRAIQHEKRKSKHE